MERFSYEVEKLMYEVAVKNEIVGFAGKKNVGKDTAANFLDSYHNVSLASPIKEVLDVVFRFDSIPDEIEEFWGLSKREAGQIVGSELFRDHVDEDIWTKSLLLRILESDHHKFAVTDVRFRREIKFIEMAGGKVFHLRRPEVEPDLSPEKVMLSKFPLLKKAASYFIEFGPEYHRSEIDLLDVPVDIVNDSTKSNLGVAVNKAVELQKNGKFEKFFPIRASDYA